MPAPIFYGVNRLESVPAVAAAGTTTDRPLLRLWDRFIDRVWEGTPPILWDGGASPLPFDTVLGAGHNLAGATVTVQTANDAGFPSSTTLGTLTVPTAGPFRIPCTGSIAQYTRLTISGGPSPVQLAELWASVATVAPNPPLLATSPNQVGNFVGQETEAGLWLAYVRSDPRWDVSWDIPGFTRTVRDSFFEFFQAIGGGARPFFVLDDESVLRFVRWVNPTTAFGGLIPTEYRATFQLREVG